MKPASSFTAITSEGGLLPADFLAELLAPKTAIEGLAPVSYNLAESERISEQVNRSWNRLEGRWTDFKKAIAEKQPGDSTTTETRDRWLHPTVQELGFGQKLPAARAVEIDGRSYPVSHGWSHVPIHLVGSHVDIDRRTPGAVGAAKASPHSLVQQALNASTGHLWGIVSNGLTFRLLRDSIALTRVCPTSFWLVAHIRRDSTPSAPSAPSAPSCAGWSSGKSPPRTKGCVPSKTSTLASKQRLPPSAPASSRIRQMPRSAKNSAAVTSPPRSSTARCSTSSIGCSSSSSRRTAACRIRRMKAKPRSRPAAATSTFTPSPACARSRPTARARRIPACGRSSNSSPANSAARHHPGRQ